MRYSRLEPYVIKYDASMRYSRLGPSVVNYNAAISSFDKGQDWMQALILQEEVWRSRLEFDLTGDIAADVCVVGGGIAGCATALFLAERGYQVVLLEGNRIAFGASGRSGGQAIVGYACSQDKLIAQVGPADAKRMFDVSVDGVSLVKTYKSSFAQIITDGGIGKLIETLQSKNKDLGL